MPRRSLRCHETLHEERKIKLRPDHLKLMRMILNDLPVSFLIAYNKDVVVSRRCIQCKFKRNRSW